MFFLEKSTVNIKTKSLFGQVLKKLPSIVFLTLENNKSDIVEYGGYGEKDQNNFNENQIYYFYKRENGLRFYEATFLDLKKVVDRPYYITWKKNDKTLIEILQEACKKEKWRKCDYILNSHNCQYFVSKLF